MIGFGVAQTEIAVIIGQSETVWTLFRSLRLVGHRQGGLHLYLLLLLTFFFGQVGVGVVVAQAGTVLVALPTDCHQNHKRQHV